MNESTLVTCDRCGEPIPPGGYSIDIYTSATVYDETGDVDKACEDASFELDYVVLCPKCWTEYVAKALRGFLVNITNKNMEAIQ